MLSRVVVRHYKKDLDYPDSKENLIKFGKTAAKYSESLARSITRTTWTSRTSKAMVRGPHFRFSNRPKPKPRTLHPPI